MAHSFFVHTVTAPPPPVKACALTPAYPSVRLAYRDQRYLARSPGGPYLVFLCCVCDHYHVGVQGLQRRGGRP